MKKFTTVAGLLLIAATGLIAQDTKEKSNETTVIQREAGDETISSLRQAYEQGAYESMLAELNSDYQNYISSGHLSEFLNMREVPPMDDKINQLAAQWEDLHQKLLEERNAQLREACDGSDNQLICQRVDSVTSQMPLDQKDALKYLASLRFKTPDMAANADEKTLIEIDLASEFKILHLDGQYAAKPFDDRVQKHIVIKMDMLKQMQEAAKSFKDRDLAKKVDLAAAGYDTWQSRNWDLNKLNTMVKKPTGDLEKKIASILTTYKAQKEDLYQKEFLAKLD